MHIQIFGIRHHGPGSARSLLQALNHFAPDVVLIEGPPDAESLIPGVAHAGIQTPVAMLVYNPKNLSQASFLPFAEFSPEWQAMRYGLDLERYKRIGKEIVIMHPGPINRGVEVTSQVADHANSIILDQVENGVAIRMAVLYLLAARIPRPTV